MEQWLRKEDFGELWPFIEDRNVTDIDYTGYSLWITDLQRGRYRSEVVLSDSFVTAFSDRIADYVNKQFNKMNNVLEAQTEGLRITITHESVAVTGRAISIRKSPPEVRNTSESLIDTKFCQEETLNFLTYAVKSRMNVAFCGEPGVGKTECAKFFAGAIDEKERIITIEDNLELHLHEIYPERNIEELLINEQFSYSDAIKHCLRKNPKWVILSEARSTEVKYLLEQWSTGVRGFTTLHLDDLRNLPDRIMNMIGKSADAERLENNIYEYISVGVLIRRKEDAGKIERYIDQVAVYNRENGKNGIHMLVENGDIVTEKLPDKIQRIFQTAGYPKPFQKDGKTIEMRRTGT